MRDAPAPQSAVRIDPQVRDPTSAPLQGRLLVLALAVVLALTLVTLGAAGAVLLIQRGDSPAAASGHATSTNTTELTGTVEPTDTTTTIDPENTAAFELKTLRDGDLRTVSLDASWVAQLASKYVGIVDPEQITEGGGHVFGAVDILAEHRRLRYGDNLGARVVLLLSTDYDKRQLVNGNPLWVTFALGNFGSAEDVDAWCHRRFPQLSSTQLTNACTARRLRPPD